MTFLFNKKNLKDFKEQLATNKRIYSQIVAGLITYEILVKQLGEKFKSKYNNIEEFKASTYEMIQCYESSLWMCYNSDLSVSKTALDKFYKKFIKATEEEKALYEETNGSSYEEILDDLNKMKKQFDSKNDESSDKIRNRLIKMEHEMEDRAKLKQELVALGIAKDTGNSNIIEVKPERFVDYLKFLESHPNLKI